VDEHPEEYGHLDEAMRKTSALKWREIIHETVTEYNRCGEFVRIFPSKGSKQYEKYFSGVFGTRILNRLIHKVLFTNEILPYEKTGGKKATDPKNLKYNIDVPLEHTYDHYKNKAAQRQKSSTNRADSFKKSQNATPDAREETKAREEEKQTYQRGSGSIRDKKTALNDRKQSKPDVNDQ